MTTNVEMSELIPSAKVTTLCRAPDMESVWNFRDLGGYQSLDGRRLKWQLVFRSGHLAKLNDGDQQRIQGYPITQIHDLRRDKERDEFPSQLSGDIRFFHYELSAASVGMFVEQLAAGELNLAKSHALMVEAYREFISGCFEQFSQVIHRVGQLGTGAVLFHCMAGKDRTGLAIALLLLVLDIPRKTIIEDYLLTLEYFPVDRALQFLSRRMALQGLDIKDLVAAKPYCTVHSDYINAAFDEIDQKFGGDREYIRNQLKVSQELQEKIKELLLSSKD